MGARMSIEVAITILVVAIVVAQGLVDAIVEWFEHRRDPR